MLCFYGARSAWAGMDVVCAVVPDRTGQQDRTTVQDNSTGQQYRTTVQFSTGQDSRGLVPEVLYCTSELSHRRLPGHCSWSVELITDYNWRNPDVNLRLHRVYRSPVVSYLLRRKSVPDPCCH
jgi:hypothetical protein